MLLALSAAVGLPQRATAVEVPRFGVFEAAFEQAGADANPYLEVTATVTLQPPAGQESRTMPLFWDGGRAWKLRFSPDVTGQWQWSVSSSDPGLDGQAGAFYCVPSANRGSVVPMPGHPLHFAYQDGTPLWWMGDTAWALYTDNADEGHDRAAVEHYLDVRAAQGINVIHSMLISELDWGNSGGMPFHGLAEQTINPAYWQEVDARLQSLTGRGLIAGLVLAWTDKRRSQQSWQHFPDDEARVRYARYVVARYSAYPVYFVIAGEWDLSRDNEMARRTYEAVGSEIAACDPHGRMRAIHSSGGSLGELKPYAHSPWNSFGDYQQVYLDLHAAILTCRDQGKPVVNAEYAYYLRQADDGTIVKPNSASTDIIRAATWDIAMAGGYFVTGFGSTYLGGARTRGPFDVDTPDNDDWEAEMQIVRAFFAERECWRLEPHDELVSGPVPRGVDERGRGGGDIRPAQVTYWCLADPGREYLVYIRGHQGRLSLSLGENDQGVAFRVRRLDPRTGEYLSLPNHIGPGDLPLATPDDQDWAFEVRAGA